jgi:hypothetical protein
MPTSTRIPHTGIDVNFDWLAARVVGFVAVGVGEMKHVFVFMWTSRSLFKRLDLDIGWRRLDDFFSVGKTSAMRLARRGWRWTVCAHARIDS